jgi:hypothetical protein
MQFCHRVLGGLEGLARWSSNEGGGDRGGGQFCHRVLGGLEGLTRWSSN